MYVLHYCAYPKEAALYNVPRVVVYCCHRANEGVNRREELMLRRRPPARRDDAALQDGAGVQVRALYWRCMQSTSLWSMPERTPIYPTDKLPGGDIYMYVRIYRSLSNLAFD